MCVYVCMVTDGCVVNITVVSCDEIEDENQLRDKLEDKNSTKDNSLSKVKQSYFFYFNLCLMFCHGFDIGCIHIQMDTHTHIHTKQMNKTVNEKMF